jgi:hypothetical protein
MASVAHQAGIHAQLAGCFSRRRKGFSAQQCHIQLLADEVGESQRALEPSTPTAEIKRFSGERRIPCELRGHRPQSNRDTNRISSASIPAAKCGAATRENPLRKETSVQRCSPTQRVRCVTLSATLAV